MLCCLCKVVIMNHFQVFDISGLSIFYSCVVVTDILIFSCYRKDKGMVESVSLTFCIFMLIETLRVNQVIWTLGLPVLVHYVSAHSSPHKEIFALYSFFSFVMVRWCVWSVWFTVQLFLPRKSNWTCWNTAQTQLPSEILCFFVNQIVPITFVERFL